LEGSSCSNLIALLEDATRLRVDEHRHRGFFFNPVLFRNESFGEGARCRIACRR
jgi:hypothetical protein